MGLLVAMIDTVPDDGPQFQISNGGARDLERRYRYSSALRFIFLFVFFVRGTYKKKIQKHNYRGNQQMFVFHFGIFVVP